jgi:hypothetical protein
VQQPQVGAPNPERFRDRGHRRLGGPAIDRGVGNADDERVSATSANRHPR